VFRWLVDNLSTLALAFILALFVWIVAIREVNPIVEQPFQEPVPIVMVNQPAGSQMTNDPVRPIEVVVRGPRQEIEELRVDDFSAIIDLSTVPFGGAQVPVQVVVDNPLVTLVSQDTDQVYVELEEFRRLSIPVTPTIVGVPALGHVSGAAQVEPDTVSVEGRASVVDQVSAATVRVSIEGERGTVRESVSVRLRDSNNRSILGAEPVPSEVWVTVPITKSDEYAELLVTLNLTGTVATGYRLADFSVDPQKVTIFGAPEVVAELPGYISTEMVDISEADSDITQRVGLQVPEGVTLIDVKSVVVDIDVEPVLTTSTFPWRPQILGPDPGLTATVLPPMLNVTVIGPLALIDAFDPETDLSLTVDLNGLAAGSYQIEPDALSNLLGVEIDAILPAAVLAEIAVLPTPTPTATPVITGTATVTGTLVPSPLATPAVAATPTGPPAATPTVGAPP
jgi:YbbR domain-containing protein